MPQPVQVDPVTHCKEKDIDDCWFYFTYSVNGNNEAMVHVVETPGTSQKMPSIVSYDALLLLRVIAGTLVAETVCVFILLFI